MRLAPLLLAATIGSLGQPQADGTLAPRPGGVEARPGTIEQAQWLFYNARYEAAAALTLEPCSANGDGLAACELRTAAVLFQIRRAFGEPKDKQKALALCTACPDLLTTFQSVHARGLAVARERLRTVPGDQETLFLLGKINLNYVWLHIGTLGRRTGWGEYWEARHSLDKVLERNPAHVRARVARAWIDYIVDTKVPWGTRWVLGGGNKKRGLLTVREAADVEADFFVHAEARFALWDMQVRERNMVEAMATARALAKDFPENQELSKFIQTNTR
jgi:hypothetical protein